MVPYYVLEAWFVLFESGRLEVGVPRFLSHDLRKRRRNLVNWVKAKSSSDHDLEVYNPRGQRGCFLRGKICEGPFHHNRLFQIAEMKIRRRWRSHHEECLQRE